VRHLLTHTSGIVREGPAYSPLKDQTDFAVIKSAYPLPLRFTPGEKFQYCNVGYFALAEIIHKVSGKPWPEFLEERIFKPLEMTSTRATTFKEIVPHRAGGYVWMGKKYQNASAQLNVRPSGALLSTVLDLAKWDAALYGDQLLHSSTKEAMWTPAKLNDGSTSDYGFGWDFGEVNGHRLIHHGGSLAGFRSELARLVDDKLTVIVLTNADGATPMIIFHKIAALYIPELAPQKREPAGAAP
jgi:CubicO group peptidase (beta-lactamase class C family)